MTNSGLPVFTRSRGCSRGRRVFRTAHTAPHYRGGEPVGLSNMVQFPADSADSSQINDNKY